MSYLNFPNNELEKKIELASIDGSTLEPNCYGTAFFLLGVLPFDMVVHTSNNNQDIKDVLSQMEESGEPKDNSILSIHNSDDESVHMAFIKQANALLGYHRKGTMGEFSEFNDLKSVEDYVISTIEINKFKIKYFTIGKTDLTPWAKKIVKGYERYWYA